MSQHNICGNGDLKDLYTFESAIKLGNEANIQPTSAQQRRPPLSQTQLKVICLLVHGYITTPGSGALILINGSKVCFTSTLNSLKEKGLIEPVLLNGEPQAGCWRASPYGMLLAKKLSN